MKILAVYCVIVFLKIIGAIKLRFIRPFISPNRLIVKLSFKQKQNANLIAPKGRYRLSHEY